MSSSSSDLLKPYEAFEVFDIEYALYTEWLIILIIVLFTHPATLTSQDHCSINGMNY